MYLLFDVGATKFRVAVSADGATFGEPRIERTPPSFDDAVALMERLAGELSRGEKLRAAAGGIAGTFDRARETLVAAPHLPKWRGKNMRTAFAAALGVPVLLENDTALVGLGEATRGAGKGFRIVAYVTVSTGVNGVRVVDGAIDRSVFGFEIGHQTIDAGGALCPECEPKGELEAYVGGAAFERRTGARPYEVSDEGVWETHAKHLALGLRNTILHWSPEAVVLGGSMFKAPGIALDRVAAHLASLPLPFPELPKLLPAALGDFGGIHGALALCAAETSTHPR